MARMLSHATAKHGLRSGPLKNEFRRKCTLMNRSGDRFVSKASVLRLMGTKAASQSHRKCVKRVLRGLLYHIGFPARGIDSRRHPTFVVVPDATPSAPGPYEAKSGRAATTRRLRDANLVERFEPEKLDSIALAFVREHPNGATPFVYQKACKVDRFIKFGLKAGYSPRQSFESPDLARDFVATLQKTLQPYSVRNHADASLDFLQLTSALPTLKLTFPPHRRQRIAAALKEWKILRKKLDRDSRRLQSLRVKQLGFTGAPILDICRYLNDYTAMALDRDFVLVEERVERKARFTASDTQAYKRLICYLCTVIALHGQRKGATFSLTAGEIFAATAFEGAYIVSIAKHKTDYVSGPVYLAVKRHQYTALQRMARVRIALGGGPNAPVIAGLSGREPTDPFSPLETALEEKAKVPIAVTFNLIRKTAESSKGLLENAGNSAAKAADPVSSYLAHGDGVVRLHYNFRTTQQILAEARALDRVHARCVLLSMGARRELPLPTVHHGQFIHRKCDAAAQQSPISS